MTANDPGPSGVPAPRPAAAAPAVAARAQLECIAGPEKGKKFRVAPGATVIGRDPSCDVALTETPISRQHARIERSADGWVLKNLSSNGTLLNKKPIDEAPLMDGDAISVGQKTRLRFEVETVTISATGRPQFRARAAGAERDKEETDEAQEQPQGSLFQRRKKLFMVLGGYLVLIVVMAVILAVRGGGGPKGSSGPPELTLVKMVRPAPGANPLRVISKTDDGIMAEDDTGQPRFVPLTDIQSRQAEVIPGIQDALADTPFPPENMVNKVAADQCVARATELYSKREQDPAHLYRAVREFQQALAFLRNVGYLPDPRADQTYRAATKELVEKVHAAYSSAVLEEKIGHDDRAVALYNSILNRIPDTENAICKNIAMRKGVIYKRNPKVKPVPLGPGQ